jgi:chorismate mutase/prephenate dehydrogenase
MSADDLDTLRGELDALDARLIGLAAERLRTVARIRELKRGSGKHLFDRAREQEVHQRAEVHARAVGLPAPAARSLVNALLEASHALQEQPPPTGADRRAFLIVGGAGKMGRLFGELFAARGHRVDVLEKGEALEPARVGAADVVMVAVPMTQAAEVTRAVAPLVGPGALLCDINSLKRDVCAALATSAGEALGTHPMFGPTVRTLRRQKVVLCPVKPGPMAAWLEGELGRMGAEIVASSPEEHDATMAVVQVLTHFGIMAMGRALARSGLTLEQTLPFTSPIYRLELAMVGRLFSQRPELYREILLQNPAGAATRDGYLAAASELGAILARGDGDAFVALFEETGRYFAGFSAEAMELSDHIIDTIMSRP